MSKVPGVGPVSLTEVIQAMVAQACYDALNAFRQQWADEVEGQMLHPASEVPAIIRKYERMCLAALDTLDPVPF